MASLLIIPCIWKTSLTICTFAIFRFYAGDFVMKMKLAGPLFGLAILFGCGPRNTQTSESPAILQEVNVYTHRHYPSDQQLFADFTKKTGVNVNVVNASADELLKRLKLEGEQSPADVLITVDAGRLHRAKASNLLSVVNSQVLDGNIPEHFRDPENTWYGLTYRARVIAYSLERVNPDDLSTYEDLASSKWKNRILVRSSSNIYNQSLLASILAADGPESAQQWVKAVVGNFARDPKGNDRDQIKAIAAGVGDLALVNTYYIGKLLDSDNPEEVKAGQAVGIFFPNQNERGAHINISGAGVTRYAPHPENAVKFLEFLSGEEAQKVFAQANFEYPVKIGVAVAPLLDSLGDFKSDELSLSILGEKNSEAVRIFDRAGWK